MAVRWEYTIESIHPCNLECELERLGEQGWEAISLSEKTSTGWSGGDYYRAFFKRIKDDRGINGKG